LDHGALLAEHWQFTANETAFFLTLINLARAGNDALKRVLSQQLQAQREQARELAQRFRARSIEQERRNKLEADYYLSWNWQWLHVLTGLESRVSILGYIQRGGTPSPLDRLLATRVGAAAADLVAAGTFGVMVAARGDARIQIFSLEPPQQLDEAGNDAVLGVQRTHVGSSETMERMLVVRDLETLRPNTAVRDMSAPFALAGDAAIVAAKHADVIRVVALSGKEPPKELSVRAGFERLALSADGQRLAVMYATAEPEVWDVATGKLVSTLSGRRALLSATGRYALAWDANQQPTARTEPSQRHGIACLMLISHCFAITNPILL
jgi:hypothetical protein